MYTAVFRRDNPIVFAMGLSYFCSAEFIRSLRPFGTREALLERPQALPGTRDAQLEQPQALPGTRDALLERPQGKPPGLWNGRRLLRPLYCSLAGDNISVLFPLERAKRNWNSRRLLRPLYCSLAGDNISVLFHLERPSGLLEQPIGLLERPSAQGKHSNTLGNTPPLIDRLHTYCRLNAVLMHTLRKIHLQTACNLFLIPKRLNPLFKIHFGTANAVLNELPAIPEGSVCRAENVAYIVDVQSQN